MSWMATETILRRSAIACKTKTAKTDFFGDFWFDGLESRRTYKVTISKPGAASVTRLVTLYKVTNLGEIKL